MEATMSQMEQTKPTPASPFTDPPGEPWPLVDHWLDEAERDASVPYATAACLATIGPGGWPEARIVLASRHPPDAFVVLTDQRSPKARQLDTDPRSALTFYWPSLERQLRMRCRAEPADEAVAEALFEGRPRQSRGTAWACRQSRPLPEPSDLDERMAQIDQRFAGREAIPRPNFWQAFRLVPITVELWQAAARRLHHRLFYQREEDGGWNHHRLEP